MTDRLSVTAAIAVRHAGAYTDLILSDLDAAAKALRQRVIATVVLGCAALIAILLACAWIVAATWDTAARGWTIGGLLALFLAIAAGALWRLYVLQATTPGVMSQTTSEWAKDRRVLEELLARERAATP
jgi:uncharacterized membrane protein YqjE